MNMGWTTPDSRLPSPKTEGQPEKEANSGAGDVAKPGGQATELTPEFGWLPSWKTRELGRQAAITDFSEGSPFPWDNPHKWGQWWTNIAHMTPGYIFVFITQKH